MHLFRRKPQPELFPTARFTSVMQARELILARLAHRAGPPWHQQTGDPFSWLEQVYYTLQDDPSRQHFAMALIELLREPGARWAALSLARMLRLQVAVPALLELARSGELRHTAEGSCTDLQIYLIVTLEELEVREAIPFLMQQLGDETYAVSACLALLRLDPKLVIPHLPDVATASSQAREGSSGTLGTIGVVLATALRDRDVETFSAMVRALEGCDRRVRLHIAETLRRQTELEVHPGLEADARRRLLHDEC